MMRLKNKLLLVALSSLFVGACAAEPAAEEETLRVSAASSLSGVMEELTAGFKKGNPEIAVVANYGSSSKLRNQIENGAPSDVFLSASDNDVELMVEAGLVTEESVAPFAGNSLLIAAAPEAGEKTEIAEILSSLDSKLAIAEPASVPLGSYTKQALEEMGIWQSLKGQMIYAKDARQVVTYLESGNAQAGIIYASDAQLSDTVKQMNTMPLESAPIIYPAAIIEDSSQQQNAEKFMNYILSEEGQSTIEDFGFLAAEGLQP